MSTKVKWLLAASLVMLLMFLMQEFPASHTDSYVKGNEVWVVAGHTGSLGQLPTGATGIGNHWSGDVTLTVHVPGKPDIVAHTSSTEDWGKSITMSKQRALAVGFDATIPAGLAVGTDLAGTVTGTVVTPQYVKGQFENAQTTVNQPVTVHVVSKGTVNEKWNAQSRLPGWIPTWVLVIPISLFVVFGVLNRRHTNR